mmetsp:Transcript_32739/g.54274  ORF Transcript_32739/g.54274 Transcript_32739/m.54274 type:complete len:262 (+) Transcript_32739:597-1382(+)
MVASRANCASPPPAASSEQPLRSTWEGSKPHCRARSRKCSEYTRQAAGNTAGPPGAAGSPLWAATAPIRSTKAFASPSSIRLRLNLFFSLNWSLAKTPAESSMNCTKKMRKTCGSTSPSTPAANAATSSLGAWTLTSMENACLMRCCQTGSREHSSGIKPLSVPSGSPQSMCRKAVSSHLSWCSTSWLSSGSALATMLQKFTLFPRSWMAIMAVITSRGESLVLASVKASVVSSLRELKVSLLNGTWFSEGLLLPTSTQTS